MSYPYWPNGSVVGYQTLAFNSNTNVLTLAPGGNSVNLTTSGGGSSNINTNTIHASSISLYQDGGFGDYAVYVSSSGTAQMRIAGGTPGFAEFVMSGQFANMAIEGKPQCSIAITQPAVEGRVAGFGTTGAGQDITRFYCWNNNADSYYELASYTTPYAPTGKTQLYQYASGQSNSLILSDAGGTDLAGIRMSAEGGGNVFAFPNMSTITAQAQTYVASQQSGLGTQYQTRLFNGNTIDIASVMPMATVLDGETMRFSSDSKIACFSAMAPGSNYMTIPGTTFAGATGVMLAPYATLELYTGPMGSGASSVYVNQGNAYYSTFNGDANLNGNTFNSYKMFFGN